MQCEAAEKQNKEDMERSLGAPQCMLSERTKVRTLSIVWHVLLRKWGGKLYRHFCLCLQNEEQEKWFNVGDREEHGKGTKVEMRLLRVYLSV